MEDHRCPQCGDTFVPRRGGKPQRYCSKECYAAAARERRRLRSLAEPRLGPSPCAVCGTPTRRYGTTPYCPDPACKRERNRRLGAAWQERNREKQRAASRAHYHKVGSAAWDRYRKNRAIPVEQRQLTTTAKVAARFAFFGWRCWICGATDALERDHVKPLSEGGPHLPANIRPICGTCNRSKGATWPLLP